MSEMCVPDATIENNNNSTNDSTANDCSNNIISATSSNNTNSDTSSNISSEICSNVQGFFLKCSNDKCRTCTSNSSNHFSTSECPCKEHNHYLKCLEQKQTNLRDGLSDCSSALSNSRSASGLLRVSSSSSVNSINQTFIKSSVQVDNQNGIHYHAKELSSCTKLSGENRSKKMDKPLNRIVKGENDESSTTLARLYSRTLSSISYLIALCDQFKLIGSLGPQIKEAKVVCVNSLEEIIKLVNIKPHCTKPNHQPNINSSISVNNQLTMLRDYFASFFQLSEKKDTKSSCDHLRDQHHTSIHRKTSINVRDHDTSLHLKDDHNDSTELNKTHHLNKSPSSRSNHKSQRSSKSTQFRHFNGHFLNHLFVFFLLATTSSAYDYPASNTNYNLSNINGFNGYQLLNNNNNPRHSSISSSSRRSSFASGRKLNYFEDLNNELFNHMTINPFNNDIYIGAVNRLYQLNSNLEVKHVANMGPQLDSPDCPGLGIKNCPQIEKKLTNYYNKVLLVDKRNMRLISCGTLFQGACSLHRLDNISIMDSTLAENVAANSPNASTVAFIAPRNNVMYIGVTYTNNGPYSSDVPAVASRSLENNTMFTITHNSVTTGTRLLVNVMARERYPIQYIFGFSANNFSYLLTVQKVSMDSNVFQSKLVRVCQDDAHYYSYIEVPLVCKSNTAKIDYNLAQSAYVGKPGSELAQSLGISEHEDVLYVAFSRASSEHADVFNRPSEQSALCAYAISTVHRKFTQNIQHCFNGNGQQGLEFVNIRQPCISSASFESAQKQVRECFELCIKRRPRRGLNLFNNNLHQSKINFYTEQEIHAELCYADCTLLLLALDSILNGKDNLDQICNSVKLKSCFNAYKSCYDILQRRTYYQNESSRNKFKLGVFFGLSIINMFAQDLPASIQSTMKFDIDFSFDYETALEDASSQLHIRQMLAIVFQLVYKIHRQETYGECSSFDTCERIIRYGFEQYSESCLLHYLDGKVKQLTGQHAAAIEQFEISLASNSVIGSLQYHCEYNLAICLALKQCWLKAADAALFLANSSQTLYSPILMRYMYICFMQMHFFYIDHNLYDSWNGYLDNNIVVNNHDIEFKLTTADSTDRDGSGCSSRTERSESLSYSTSRTNSMTDSINMIHASWKKLEELPFSDAVHKTNLRLLDERLEQMTEREFNEELTNQFEIISKFKYPKGKQLDSVEVLCVINANKYLKTGRLVLPAIELFYWLDLFVYLKERKDLVNSIIKLIDIELVEEDELKDEPNADMDNFALLYLLKGACLATKKEYDQAVKCFKEILYW